jgi:hypothetical protein
VVAVLARVVVVPDGFAPEVAHAASIRPPATTIPSDRTMLVIPILPWESGVSRSRGRPIQT